MDTSICFFVGMLTPNHFTVHGADGLKATATMLGPELDLDSRMSHPNASRVSHRVFWRDGLITKSWPSAVS